MKITQPLDMDPVFATLFNAFGDGRPFGQHHVTDLLGPGANPRKVLREIKETLADCPEGVQLVARRGSIPLGGGHRFIESVDRGASEIV